MKLQNSCKYKSFYLYVGCFLVTMGIILTIKPIYANLEVSDIYICTEDTHVNCNFKLENHDDYAWYYIKERVDFKNENININDIIDIRIK